LRLRLKAVGDLQSRTEHRW